MYKSYYEWLGIFGSKNTVNALVKDNIELKKGLSNFEASLVGEKSFDSIEFQKTLHLLRTLIFQKKQKNVESLAQELNPN